jgi:hypothetical protein
MCERHVLCDLPVRAIGRCGACDDVLFEVLDGTRRFAIVHLTWAKDRERDERWPAASIIEDSKEFEKIMHADHKDR